MFSVGSREKWQMKTYKKPNNGSMIIQYVFLWIIIFTFNQNDMIKKCHFMTALRFNGSEQPVATCVDTELARNELFFLVLAYNTGTPAF